MTECDVSIQTEHRVFVHFYQNNISCSCTVISLFDGELHVMFSKTENRKRCYDNYNPYSVKVNDTVIKDCYKEGHAMFNVKTYDIVIVKAEYIANNKSMNITPCLEIYGKYYISNRFVIRQKLNSLTICRCISLFQKVNEYIKDILRHTCTCTNTAYLFSAYMMALKLLFDKSFMIE